jgi:hypothetical protein
MPWCRSAESRFKFTVVDFEVDSDIPYLDKWFAFRDVIANETMPPAPQEQLSDCEVATFNKWLKSAEEQVELQDPSLTCQDGDPILPRSLNRLTRSEYVGSLESIFGRELIEDLDAKLSLLPLESSTGGFSGMSFTLSADHLNAFNVVASAIASRALQRLDFTNKYIPCPLDSVTSFCFKKFTEQLGSKVIRRPMSSTEVDRIETALYAIEDGRQSIQQAISYLLQSPEFLYHLEINGTLDSFRNLVQLDNFEIASRRSYLIYGSSPDDELTSLAVKGQLSDQEIVKAQVNRMMASPKARNSFSLFVIEWLKLNKNLTLNQSGDYFAGISPINLVSDANQQLIDFVTDIVFEKQGTYFDLHNANEANVKSENLAKIYGPGIGVGSQVVLPSDHAGLLGQPRLLMNVGLESSPIRRGAFLLTNILCKELHAPNPNDFPPNALLPPPIDPNSTTRQRWEAKTGASSCQICHNLINPMGFAFESFDSIGRSRDIETIFNEAGTVVGSLPINTEVGLPFGGRSKRVVSGADELKQILGDFPVAQKCFAKQWYRYSQKKMETVKDRCTINFSRTFEKKGSLPLIEVMKDQAIQPNFFTREYLP